LDEEWGKAMEELLVIASDWQKVILSGNKWELQRDMLWELQ